MKLIITIISVAFASIAFSQTLDSILADHAQQREIVLRPLEEKYDAELSKLLQKLTAAGKLEESVEVDRLIKERTHGGPKDVIGSWLIDDGSGLVLNVEENGSVRVVGWPKAGRWLHTSGRTVEITTSSGDKSTLAINPDLKSGTYKSKSRDAVVRRKE